MPIPRATLVAWLAVLCGGLVCFSGELVPLGSEPAPATQGVDIEKMVTVLAKVERALQGVQTRAAEDAKLKPLARARIKQGRYPGTNGGWVSVDAQTDDRIDLPTKGIPMTLPGQIDVKVDYTARPSDWRPSAGLFHGRVMWKTDNPNVSVMLGWTTRDTKAPERLLKIVREELQNQGIRIMPAQESAWPAATAAEHLARLPTPATTASTTGTRSPSLRQPSGQRQPPATLRPVEGDAKGAEKTFATPQDVVTVYRRAYATKNWRNCFICLAPEARGATLREFYFVASFGNTHELVKSIEKHVEVKFFEDATRNLSKEMGEVLKAALKEVDGRHECDNALLYWSFRKRVRDVPVLVAECCRSWPLFIDFGEVKGIRIEGDKAAGYRTQTPVPFDPRQPSYLPPESYLPQYYPVHFRRIGGNWFLADAPLHQ